MKTRNFTAAAIMAFLFALLVTPISGCNNTRDEPAAKAPTQVPVTSMGAPTAAEVADSTPELPVPNMSQVLFVRKTPFKLEGRISSKPCEEQKQCIIISTSMIWSSSVVVYEDEGCVDKIKISLDENRYVVGDRKIDLDVVAKEQVCEAWPYRDNQDVMVDHTIFKSDLPDDFQPYWPRIVINGVEFYNTDLAMRELNKFTGVKWVVQHMKQYDSDTHAIEAVATVNGAERDVTKDLATTRLDTGKQGIDAIKVAVDTLKTGMIGAVIPTNGNTVHGITAVVDMVRSFGMSVGPRVQGWFNLLSHTDQVEVANALAKIAAPFAKHFEPRLVNRFVLGTTWDKIKGVQIEYTPWGNWEEPWKEGSDLTNGDVYLIAFWQRRGELVFTAVQDAVRKEYGTAGTPK